MYRQSFKEFDNLNQTDCEDRTSEKLGEKQGDESAIKAGARLQHRMRAILSYRIAQFQRATEKIRRRLVLVHYAKNESTTQPAPNE